MFIDQIYKEGPRLQGAYSECSSVVVLTVHWKIQGELHGDIPQMGLNGMVGPRLSLYTYHLSFLVFVYLHSAPDGPHPSFLKGNGLLSCIFPIEPVGINSHYGAAEWMQGRHGSAAWSGHSPPKDVRSGSGHQ